MEWNKIKFIFGMMTFLIMGSLFRSELVKATCDGTGYDGCVAGYSCSGSPTVQTYTCGDYNDPSHNPRYCADVRGADEFLSCNGSCQWSTNSSHGCLNRFSPSCSNDTSGRSGNCCSACGSNPTPTTGSGGGGGPVPTSPPCSGDCNPAKGNNDGLYAGDASLCQIAGWACDPDDYNRSINVHIYEGGTFLTGGNASVYRGDVAAAGWACGGTGNHGFVMNLPASIKTGTGHAITAYALGINSSGGETGANPQIGTVTVTCNLPNPTCGSVSLGIPNPYCLRSGTYNMSVGGVSNATAVRFVTWTAAGGASDAVWQSAGGGGANWSATINAGAYGPEDGTVWHEVYARNGSGPEVRSFAIAWKCPTDITA
jgi:hypothetical protein